MEYLTNPIFYLLAVPAILIIGLSKGGFGGGLGVVAVPLIAFIMPVSTAAGIMLPILVVMDFLGIWAFRNKWDAKILYILIPAAFIGIVIGSFSFEYLHEAWVRLITGLIATMFAAKYFIEKYKLSKGVDLVPSKPFGRLAGYFWGSVGGFTSFVAHAGGPPVDAYLLSQRFEKTIFQATTVFFFTFVNIVKLVPYTLIGQFDGDNLWVSAVLMPLAPIGMWVGIKLHYSVSPKHFYTICYSFLLVAGVKLISDWVVYFVEII
ncbi:MAG: sulfite exporter TauE/SafE family protein [Rhizobiales bacterium]|nr:sulfite exporter TauE/SafE family protein [Hyphomicrobiales bacterium]NRB15627.1 sulfite exporter TauE/SafE family protein [Hyphomicrobiales bacterium]